MRGSRLAPGKIKQAMLKDEQHTYVRGATEKQMLWYEKDERVGHFKRDADDDQTAWLGHERKAIITELRRSSLTHFGYL